MKMELREIGKTGIMVTPMAFGSWEAGGGPEWGVKKPDEDYIAAIKTAIEGGVNFIDSAVFYGHGHAEELVGKAIKDYDRSKLVISTKQVAGFLTKDKARQTVTECLQRLDTDYIDVFLVHWPNPDVEIGENMEALNQLKEEGLIRAIGVSNYTLEHIKRAMKYTKVDIIQPCFSLYWRHQLQDEILPYCMDNDIGVMTYSSIAQGLLTDNLIAEKHLDPGDQRDAIVPLFSDEIYPKTQETGKRIREIAKKYGKTVTQAAINWVMSTPGITTAIVGATYASESKENLGAFGWKLSDEDYKAMGDIGLEIADLIADWNTLFRKDHPNLKL